jgi:hypothetical protein
MDYLTVSLKSLTNSAKTVVVLGPFSANFVGQDKEKFPEVLFESIGIPIRYLNPS